MEKEKALSNLVSKHLLFIGDTGLKIPWRMAHTSIGIYTPSKKGDVLKAQMALRTSPWFCGIFKLIRQQRTGRGHKAVWQLWPSKFTLLS